MKRRLHMLRPAVLSLAVLAVAACSPTPEDDADSQGANINAAEGLPADYDFAWDGGEALPEKDVWAPMYKRADEIAEGLSQKSRFTLKPKEIGGSSLYAYVDEGDKRHGLWLPPNASTWILEEIFAFNLSRLFGHGDWAAPALRLTLDKTGSATYRAMIEGMNVKGIQACNKDHQLKYMTNNPSYFIGIYKEFLAGTKVGDVRALVKDDALNGDHPVARFLSQDSPRRATSAPVYLVKSNGSHDIVVQGAANYEAAKANHVAESTEAEVAAQLNHMMVVDVLNNQRDRYGSGTNMNVFIEKETGKFRIALIDNGGGSATIPQTYVKDFLAKVKRFDPTLARNVLDLDAFLNKGSGGPYKGFTSEDALKRALGYEDVDTNGFGSYVSDCGKWKFPSVGSYKGRWDLKWKNFKTALGTLAKHIEANNQAIAE